MLLARRSIAVPWRERPRDLASWSAKPAAREVVAHATLSLAGAVRRRTHASGGHRGRADPRREQPPSRSDCAAHNSRAQGASRFLGSAPPALRAADGLDRASRSRVLANYRRPQRKCLTTVRSGVTVESSSPAAVRGPSTSPDVEHVRIGGLRPRFVSHFSNHSWLSLRRDVTSAKLTTESDCASVPRQAQIRPCTTRPEHHAATAVRLSEVDASGDALSAPIHREQQRHRRSEWAGVSWPKDDDHERDAAGGGALARRQGTSHKPITPPMLRSVRSFARWRARPHGSASIEN